MIHRVAPDLVWKLDSIVITHSFIGATGGPYPEGLDKQTRISKILKGAVIWPSTDTDATH